VCCAGVPAADRWRAHQRACTRTTVCEPMSVPCLALTSGRHVRRAPPPAGMQYLSQTSLRRRRRSMATITCRPVAQDILQHRLCMRARQVHSSAPCMHTGKGLTRSCFHADSLQPATLQGACGQLSESRPVLPCEVQHSARSLHMISLPHKSCPVNLIQPATSTYRHGSVASTQQTACTRRARENTGTGRGSDQGGSGCTPRPWLASRASRASQVHLTSPGAPHTPAVTQGQNSQCARTPHASMRRTPPRSVYAGGPYALA